MENASYRFCDYDGNPLPPAEALLKQKKLSLLLETQRVIFTPDEPVDDDDDPLSEDENDDNDLQEDIVSDKVVKFNKKGLTEGEVRQRLKGSAEEIDELRTRRKDLAESILGRYKRKEDFLKQHGGLNTRKIDVFDFSETAKPYKDSRYTFVACLYGEWRNIARQRVLDSEPEAQDGDRVSTAGREADERAAGGD